MVYGTLSVVDYNLTVNPMTKVDLNPMPESTFPPRQGLRIWPQKIVGEYIQVYAYSIQHVLKILENNVTINYISKKSEAWQDRNQCNYSSL
jgi:hypothetical protein